MEAKPRVTNRTGFKTTLSGSGIRKINSLQSISRRKIMQAMKCKAVSLLLCISMVAAPVVLYAKPAINGYDGGIAAELSTGKTSNKTSYEYQENLFITGEPITLTGTLTITTKSSKGSHLITTYQYNLSNIEKNITLSRTVELDTTVTIASNGQIIEQTVINSSRKPTETIRTRDTTYTLESWGFSRSIVKDIQPAVNYFAGEVTGSKVYRKGGTGLASTGKVKVDLSGKIVGYDQYWGSTETQTLFYTIEAENKLNSGVDKWGGTVDIKVSTSTSKQIRYLENQPEQISFEGGFVQATNSSSIMEYQARLPEFTSEGKSTDYLRYYGDTAKVETFPVTNMLVVPDLFHMRGHWAKKDVELLFSLGVFQGNPQSFDPNEYMTRGEFADAVNRAAREVPDDGTGNLNTSGTGAGTGTSGSNPFLRSGGTTSSEARASKGTDSVPQSTFADVPTYSQYFDSIEEVYNRKLMQGVSNEPRIFAPNEYITVAQALTIFIGALGLESLAPSEYPVTMFRDNDEIPDWAKKAVYVAQRIGLAAGDEYGYLKPNEPLTKARAAVFLNKLIDYMRGDMVKDYRERIIRYQ